MKKAIAWRRKRRLLAIVAAAVSLALASALVLSQTTHGEHVSTTTTKSTSLSASFAASAATYVTNSAPNSSEWLIVQSISSPLSVSTNNTGAVPEYTNLAALNQTKIGIYCVSVDQSGSCAEFKQYLQTGWFWDSSDKILYIHYVGGRDVKISVSTQNVHD